MSASRSLNTNSPYSQGKRGMTQARNSITDPDFRALFEAAPEAYLVLSADPPTYTIVAASDAYLRTTMVRRDEILGRGILEIFGSKPAGATAPGLDALRRSLDAVCQSLLPQTMAAERYEIALSADRGGGHDVRNWSVRNSPVVDSNGALLYICHRVEAGHPEDHDEAFLAALVESSEDAIYGKTLDGIVTSWNPGAERLYGYTSSEMIGRSIATIIPPDRPDEPAELLEKMRRGERVSHHQTERICKDGRRVVISKSMAPLRNSAGEIIGAVSIAHDITELKRSQEAQAKSEQLLATTLRSIGDAVIATDAEGRVVFLNAVAEALTGWCESEAQGRPSTEVFRIVNEQTRLPSTSPIEQVIRDGIVVGMANHTVLHTRDGREVPIDDSGAPIHDANGILLGVVLVFRDITERRRVEKELGDLLASLQQERTRIENVVSNVPGVVWEAWGRPDAAGQRINFVSPYVETLLGYTVDEWTSTPNFWLSIVHPEDQEAAAREANRAYAAEDTHRNEFRWLTKDGRALWVESYSTVVRDSSGAPIGMRGVTVDVTARKRAVEERERHLAEIEGLNVRLQRAMRETHHRVKNNLQVISALINIQTMEYGDIVPVKELHRLSHHIHALASIHDLLTRQSRLNADIDDISVQSAVEMLTPTLQSMMKERELHTDVADVDLPIHHGTTLAVLINELVSNSIKHGAGDVHLTFTVEGGNAVLSVKDSGSGFPDDFDPRVAANTGLDLISSLAEWDLQGSARYENDPDGGARVVVEFPMPTASSSG